MLEIDRPRVMRMEPTILVNKLVNHTVPLLKPEMLQAEVNSIFILALTRAVEEAFPEKVIHCTRRMEEYEKKNAEFAKYIMDEANKESLGPFVRSAMNGISDRYTSMFLETAKFELAFRVLTLSSSLTRMAKTVRATSEEAPIIMPYVGKLAEHGLFLRDTAPCAAKFKIDPTMKTCTIRSGFPSTLVETMNDSSRELRFYEYFR